MKEGWEEKRIKDVCQVIAGQSPEGKYYNSEGKGLPFYQGKKEFTDKFIGSPKTWTSSITKEAVKDDILMSVRAPVGPVNISTQKICIGRGLAAIRPSEKINRDFLFYFMQMNEINLEGNNGAVFNSINKSQIENILIPVSPLPEQLRIVAMLEDAFTAIAKAKENAKKNLQNAQELFESYLESVFANPGEDWEEKKLGEVCKFEKKSYLGNDLPYIGLENIESNTGKFISSSEDINVKSNTFLFSDRHLLYGRLRPYLKKAYLPNFKGHCSTEIFPILTGGRLERTYLFHWLLSKKITDKINKTCTCQRRIKNDGNAG